MKFIITSSIEGKLFSNNKEVFGDFEEKLPVYINYVSSRGKSEIFIGTLGDITTNSAVVVRGEDEYYLHFNERSYYPKIISQDIYKLQNAQHVVTIFEDEYNFVVESNDSFYSISEIGFENIKVRENGNDTYFYVKFEKYIYIIKFTEDYEEIAKIKGDTLSVEKNVVIEEITETSGGIEIRHVLPLYSEKISTTKKMTRKENFSAETFPVYFFELLKHGVDVRKHVIDELKGEIESLVSYVGKFEEIIPSLDGGVILTYPESPFVYTSKKFFLELEDGRVKNIVEE